MKYSTIATATTATNSSTRPPASPVSIPVMESYPFPGFAHGPDDDPVAFDTQDLDRLGGVDVVALGHDVDPLAADVRDPGRAQRGDRRAERAGSRPVALDRGLPASAGRQAGLQNDAAAERQARQQADDGQRDRERDEQREHDARGRDHEHLPRGAGADEAEPEPGQQGRRAEDARDAEAR